MTCIIVAMAYQSHYIFTLGVKNVFNMETERQRTIQWTKHRGHRLRKGKDIPERNLWTI